MRNARTYQYWNGVISANMGFSCRGRRLGLAFDSLGLLLLGLLLLAGVAGQCLLVGGGRATGFLLLGRMPLLLPRLLLVDAELVVRHHLRGGHRRAGFAGRGTLAEK